jgi:alpha-tubulin suppressor-like RCC1 family protein
MDARSAMALDVSGLTDAVAISAGRDFSCAVRMTGAVVCWGDGSRGQLGLDAVPLQRAPVEVPGITGATAAIASAASASHSCVVTTAGALVCWGANASGQLGDGTITPRIGPVTAMLDGVVAVATGGIADDGTGHTCAILTTGAVRCFGDGQLGQLGTGLPTTSPLPLPVTSLP